jgi:hypothetical protein
VSYKAHRRISTTEARMTSLNILKVKKSLRGRCIVHFQYIEVTVKITTTVSVLSPSVYSLIKNVLSVFQKYIQNVSIAGYF